MYHNIGLGLFQAMTSVSDMTSVSVMTAPIEKHLFCNSQFAFVFLISCRIGLSVPIYPAKACERTGQDSVWPLQIILEHGAELGVL